MRYTLPCEDTINLPNIKTLETIGISTDNISYDKKNLAGNIIISGDYLQDNCDDVMEFTHEIPMEFLIDDEKINPEVNIANFIYNLLPGKGVEVKFDLEVILNEEPEEVVEADIIRDEDYEELQKQVDENLENVLHPETRDDSVIVDNDNYDNNDDGDNHDTNNDYDVYENKVDFIEGEDIDYLDDNIVKMEVKQAKTEFNPGFIPKEKDKFTTYKIITLEDGETIDDCLFKRNLSRKLLVKEHEFGSNKIILKIEHE